MRAVEYAEYGAPPVLVERPAPSCEPGGVVIEVAATGVCRSDWHAWVGHDPVPLPMVPGHEFAGTVREVGADVSRVRVGQRVTVPFACGCGRRTCPQCTAGKTHICPDQRQPGFTDPGSWADLVAIPAADTNVITLPEGVGWVEAASLGCRFATAYGGLVQSELAETQWLAVHGCGGVGLSAVLIGIAMGARVIAVDVNESARQAALDLGATHALSTGPDLVEELRDRTGGGPAVSIDAIGHRDAVRASLESLAPGGRHVQLGLLLGEHASAAVPWAAIVSRELRLIGSHGLAARDYDRLLPLVAQGTLQPQRLVGRTIALDEAPKALMDMSTPVAGGPMTVIDLSR